LAFVKPVLISCIGILRLEKRYAAERLNAACARALALGTRSYTWVAR
jgi:hypothetical protein